MLVETFFSATEICVLLSMGHFDCREVEKCGVDLSYTCGDQLAQTVLCAFCSRNITLGNAISLIKPVRDAD